MSLETATYIDSLVITNPDGADQRSTADDHIRLIKGALKRTWPNVAGEISVSHGEVNKLKSLTVNVQSELTKIRTNPSNDGTVAYALTANTANSASFAVNAQSASFAGQARSASFAQSASFATFALSASFAQSAAFALTANSASYAALAGQAVSASFAQSASFAVNAQSASFAAQAGSASFAQSASFAVNAQSASFATNALSANNASSLGGIAAARYVDRASPGTLSGTVVYAVNAQNAGAGAQVYMAAAGNISGGAITITSTTPADVTGMQPGDIKLVCGPL